MDNLDQQSFREVLKSKDVDLNEEDQNTIAKFLNCNSNPTKIIQE